MIESPQGDFIMNKIIATSLILVIALGIACQPRTQKASLDITVSELLIMQGNSLMANSTLPSPKVIKTIKMMTTAYSSTPEQTDEDPFITAAGTWVRDGIIANNMLPFGTKVRIPELYGDKIFVVEDRMNRKKGFYHIDIWFASYSEAKNFGSKIAQVEILES